MNKYFHEISKKEANSIIDLSLIELHYRKPKWCGYEFALSSELGCRSLFEEHKKITEKYCYNCDMFKK